MMHMMMEMFFHFRIEEPILFRGWKPMNTTAYVFSCIGIFLIAFGLEVLKFGRMRLVGKKVEEEKAKIRCESKTFLLFKKVDCCCSTEEDGLWNIPETRPLNAKTVNLAPFTRDSLLVKSHFASSILIFIQHFVDYSLMLVSMTYNWPIFLSLLAGHATGYFFLGPMMTVEESEAAGSCCS
ncbi:hypothetical protein B9Z55_013257 [Caenorhabditis nigoni]|nr:hypothetical protein B9Z55_013257 [Caenorhabditis nigoni]